MKKKAKQRSHSVTQSIQTGIRIWKKRMKDKKKERRINYALAI